MKLFRKLFAPSPSNESLNSTPQTVPSGGVMSKSSPTPLTDQEVLKLLQCGPLEKVSAEFARQLERKLNEYQRNNGQHTLADGKASR